MFFGWMGGLAIGFGLFWMFHPKEINKASHQGRQYLAYAMILAATYHKGIPSFVYSHNLNDLAIFFGIATVYGLLAFIIGCIVYRFKHRSENKTVHPKKKRAKIWGSKEDPSLDFYEKTLNELDSEQVDKGLLGKAFAETEGNTDKTKVLEAELTKEEAI